MHDAPRLRVEYPTVEKCFGGIPHFEDTPSWIYELDNPYLHGPCAPTVHELSQADLPVTGELPADLSGAYFRNGPNPLLPPKNRYHPFDGDGMVHETAVELPGPRLLHDIGFTDNFVILHDLPFFHDIDVLRRHRLRVLTFHRDIPTRFGLAPRYGSSDGSVRWFDCEPCYILHVSKFSMPGISHRVRLPGLPCRSACPGASMPPGYVAKTSTRAEQATSAPLQPCRRQAPVAVRVGVPRLPTAPESFRL